MNPIIVIFVLWSIEFCKPLKQNDTLLRGALERICMLDSVLINKIKQITIKSLVQDDDFMEALVLKGGNAISMGYGLSERASYDLDFSLEEDFAEEIEEVKKRLQELLESGFRAEGYRVFDLKLNPKPKVSKAEIQDFWGGYYLEFKLITSTDWDNYYPDIEKIRRSALSLNPDHSTKFSIDISKHEYIGDYRELKEIDGYAYYLYAPELIVFEKVRALAQKLPEYASDILKSMPYPEEERARPRDFYDIYILMENFSIDLSLAECKSLLKHVFDAKRVPHEYLRRIRNMKELHKSAYDSVKDTLSSPEDDKGFDFYFDYFITHFEHLLD